MKAIPFISLVLLTFFGCSRLDTLTPDALAQAEQKWNSHRPGRYQLTIEMSGDRVETGRFEVTVQDGKVIGVRRNGLVVTPGSSQDYSMDGLFKMLAEELSLAEKPATLGAPEGYSVYTSASFDGTTGRLIQYSRSVGGTANSIAIKVLDYRAG